jgi:4-oxalocrotonate tautomerase
MPYVNIRLLGRESPELKRGVVADVSRSLVERLGKSPQHIHITIDEVAPENWGYAGALMTDGPAAQPRPLHPSAARRRAN